MTHERSEKKVFVRRLGRHHFAHLRAIAEGVTIEDSARRYLGLEHGHQARTAHRQTVEAVRLLARRRNDPAWRLIGITWSLNAALPSLEDFVAERDLDGWSESDVAQLYAQAYPTDPKSLRRQKLRQRQLLLLEQIEQQAAEVPLPTDLVSGWFDALTSAKLIAAGMVTLGDLGARIAVAGCWYRTMPGIGSSKAQRIASHLGTLLPHLGLQQKTVFKLASPPGLLAPAAMVHQGELVQAPAPAAPLSLLPIPLAESLLCAKDDLAAVESWISARAGSKLTATAYRREALRLLLWLQYECPDKCLSQMNVDDCGNFMAFLQHIPARWISRARAKPGTPSWAPFRGPLSRRSQAQSVVIVASMFTWLQSACYLSVNPWLLINQKTGDDANDKLLDSKALSESAAIEILKFIDQQPPGPARARMRFILRFVESVGLRSAELLNARLEHFQLEPEGWVMQVHGKGARNRIAAVPGQAFAALQDYLELRGIGSIDTAPPDTPLLASTLDPTKPIGYQALYEHVRGWLRKAISNSSLPLNERNRLAGASTHWLRHTFGTRAIARDVPLDVIQAQMGHASIQTTTATYGRAPIKRRVDELGKAFG